MSEGHIAEPLPTTPPTAEANRSTPSWLPWGAGLLVLVGGGLAVRHFMAQSVEHVAATASPISVSGETVAIETKAPQWRYIDTDVAKEAASIVPLPAPGRVAFDEARLSAVGVPLTGRVEQVHVRLGDHVQKGDRLFSVRSGALADVEKDIQTATAAVALKSRLAQRARELVGMRAAPEKDAMIAEADLKQAELDLKAAQARRDSLRVNADGANLFWVAASREGTVVDMDVAPNQEVSPDRGTPLVKLADLAEVLIIADVLERDAGDLAAAQKVQIFAQSESQPIEGVIEHVSEVIDPVRRTVQVRIRAPNADHLLRPNAYVEVALEAVAGQRIRVPSEAVVTDGNRSVVFVQGADGKLTRTTVRTGRERDGQIEIIAGLSAGQRYVTRGAILLLNQVDLANK